MEEEKIYYLKDQSPDNPGWIQGLNASGYAGCTREGWIVDRREFPDAVPVQANGMFGVVKPKPLPEEEIANTEMKDQVEFHLINLWKTAGMDIPDNHEDITQYCFEDVLETASKDWHSGDVAIAFRRWVEAQANTDYQMDITLYFTEAEHEGDVGLYLDDVHNSGGTNLHSELNEEAETCIILTTVTDFGEFNICSAKILICFGIVAENISV